MNKLKRGFDIGRMIGAPVDLYSQWEKEADK